MKNQVIVCLIFFASFGFVTAHAAVLTGPVVNPANGHSYLLLDHNSWTASEAEAIALGGHLATMNDAAENQFVCATFATFGGVDRPLWIGLTDQAEEGTYVWTSGEPITFATWEDGEPNNFMDEDYIYIVQNDSGHANYVPEKWNDVADSGTLVGVPVYGVVEVVPEPSAIVLLAIGALVAWTARKAEISYRPKGKTYRRARSFIPKMAAFYSFKSSESSFA
jgi:hypothetical protein